MASLEAVIEIGSTGIRLLVAEITDSADKNILDRSEVPLPLGNDVFTTGTVSRDTLLQCIRILMRFREQLAGWGIRPGQASVIATSAMREAKNRDPVLDRISVKTGFHVRVIDGIENNRLTYLAVADCVKAGSTMRRQNTLILEVGGGSTELMLIEKGKMAGAHSMRLGTVIIEQQMKSMLGSFDDARRYIEEFIRNTKSSLNNELDLKKIKHFIAVGSDALIAAINAGSPLTATLWEIPRENFDRFVDEIQNYTIEECTGRFRIPYSEAQFLQVSLLVYKLFLRLTDVQRLLVAETSIREGLILDKMNHSDAALQQDFYSQIIASAMNLLHKYHGDENHASYVRRISTKLFDGLLPELGLSEKARVLLEVSAILHDIGMFIALENHERHSHYIIQNSEIFGLSKEDITIVSLITYYHRGSRQPQDDDQFTVLPRQERMTILKLTAILRLADALDRSHEQRISEFTIRLDQDKMTIQTKGNHRYLRERLAMAQKSILFESIFGYKVIIV